MPGRLVERLSELPPDCDAISALLRIALQGRVPEKILPEAVLAEGRWVMIQSSAQIAGLEPDWFRRHAARPTPFAPGRALARIAVGALGGRLLGRGVKPGLFTALGIAVAGMGVAGGWLGQAVAAIAACGIGWLLVEYGSALRWVAGAGSGDARPDERKGLAFDQPIDLAFMAVLALAMSEAPDSLFAPFIFIGLLRLAGWLFTQKWAEFLQDRALLAIILGLAAAFGTLDLVLKGGALLLLGAMLGQAGRKSRITQT